MTATERGEISVYFLAAPEDRDVCEAIREHLAPVVKSSKVPIEISSDFEAEIGMDVNQHRQKLLDADIVLALISSDFINNDDVYEQNQRVIERYNHGQTVMIPILVRNCLWKLTPFGQQPLLPNLLPKSVQPLNNSQYWNSPDDALTAVVEDIYMLIGDIQSRIATQHVASDPVARPPEVAQSASSVDGSTSTDQGGPPPAEVETSPTRPADVPSTASSTTWEAPTSPTPAQRPSAAAHVTWQAPQQQVDVNWRDRYYRRVLWKRAVAFMLDVLIGFFLPLFIGGFVLGAVGSESEAAENTTVTIAFVVSAVVFYGVNPVFEASRWKATVGKRILKIEITDRNAGRVSFWRAFVRNVLRTLVLYSFVFVVPLILQIASFRKNKRLWHDRWSGTVIGERLET